MGSNRLKLNAEKTQLIWIGPGQQLAKLTMTQLRLINSVVEFDSMATNLGVVLDGQLSMSQQVTAVCRSCFYQLHQLKSVKSSLTREALHSLIQAFVTVSLTTATLHWLEWPKFIFRNFSLCRTWLLAWCTGALNTGGVYRFPDFRPISHYISQTIQDSAIVTIEDE